MVMTWHGGVTWQELCLKMDGLNKEVDEQERELGRGQNYMTEFRQDLQVGRLRCRRIAENSETDEFVAERGQDSGLADSGLLVALRL